MTSAQSDNLLQPVKTNSPQHAILKYLADIPAARRSRTKILDVPAGRGPVAFPMSLLGFDVSACDLFPEYGKELSVKLHANGCTAFLHDLPLPTDLQDSLAKQTNTSKPKEVEFIQGDMEKHLPFESESFDIVVSAEGIEHIGGQERFIQEVRRVLSPKGILILSTPNTLCLRSRMAFALTGQRTLNTFIDEFTEIQAKDNDRIYHGHVFLTDYFRLRYLLHNNGFRINRLLSSKSSPTCILLAPFLVPVALLFTLLAAKRWERKFHLVRFAFHS